MARTRQKPKEAIQDPLNWSEAVGYYLSRNQREKALEFLDEVISGDDMSLFHDVEEQASRRRLAWLYKIDLLRSWGRSMEALAWVCLESDLSPTNVSAAALKERLKREMGLIKRSGADSNRSDRHSSKVHPASWDGVAGMRELKAMLERDVILPLLEPEIYKRYRVDLPNGILLYGPPGCGKTYIARHLAKILGFHFIEIKPSDLASIYVHGSQEKIGDLFTDAKSNKPCMLFFDELDALVPNRNQSYQAYANEVNEFLVHLNESWKNGVFVVGATNLLNRIDPAVRRPGRLDKKVFVGPPDYEARVDLLKLYMTERPQTEIDWHLLAKILENYTCAEIEFIVNEAARTALEDRRPITTNDLSESARANPPAHTKQMIEDMKTQ